MKSFLLMISYFTRIPVGRRVEYTDDRYNAGIKYYALVGLVIGLIVALPQIISGFLNFYINKEIISIVTILVYLWATGGIHIDGFSDTIDGIYSGREKEKILEIMKDSRVGAFGAIGMIILFLSYFVLFKEASIITLIIMPFIGKGAAMYSASVSKYAREEVGMGYHFVNNMKKKYNFITLLVVIGISIVFHQYSILISSIVTYIFVEILIRSIDKKIGGMTGDTLGYICEMAQVCFLLFMGIFMYM